MGICSDLDSRDLSFTSRRCYIKPIFATSYLLPRTAGYVNAAQIRGGFGRFFSGSESAFG